MIEGYFEYSEEECNSYGRYKENVSIGWFSFRDVEGIDGNLIDKKKYKNVIVANGRLILNIQIWQIYLLDYHGISSIVFGNLEKLQKSENLLFFLNKPLLSSIVF